MDNKTKNVNKLIKEITFNILTTLNNELYEFDSWNENTTASLLNYDAQTKELKRALNEITANCDNLHLDNKCLKKTLTEEYSELEVLNLELNSVESKYNSLERELEKIEQQCLKTKKETEISSTDKKVMDLSRKKYEIFGKLTNIVWDYTIPLQSTIMAGYVKNSEKQYIHSFKIKKNEEAKEKIWQEIKLSTGEDWSDIVAMTNIKSVDSL